MNLSFFVPGIPKTAGSKRVFPVRKKIGGQWVPTGRHIVTDDAGEEGKAWRQQVVHEAFTMMQRENLRIIEDAPVSLTVSFNMPRPKGHRKKDGSLKPNAPSYHIKKPDTTKLLRAIEDALTGVVWRDDAQVSMQTAIKQYTDENSNGAQIVIQRLGLEAT